VVRFSLRTSGTVHGYASYLLSFTRVRSHYVRQQWPGDIDLQTATRVAIFSHFDRHGTVPEFVHFYLQEIAKAGYTLIFVTSAPTLRPADLARLTPLSGLILRRKNVGLDFGNFKDAIARIPDLSRLDSLLLANDSVYGPFHPLAPLIERMDLTAGDVWSITDNWTWRFHLQTYFVLFGRRALESEAFRRFWRRVRYAQAKTAVIMWCEFGLTRSMIRGGLRCRALFPHRAVALAMTEAHHSAKGRGKDRLDPRRKRFSAMVADAIEEGLPLNLTHFLWDFLIAEMGCPFVKRDLLQRNPVRVPGLQRWEEVIRSVSQYDTDLIAQHLEMSVRDRSI
jgi:lipopolysaccharide biosynthesis protein